LGANAEEVWAVQAGQLRNHEVLRLAVRAVGMTVRDIDGLETRISKPELRPGGAGSRFSSFAWPQIVQISTGGYCYLFEEKDFGVGVLSVFSN
jgi:hypothetical protein